MQVRGYSSKQYFAVSNGRRRRRFARLRISTIPREWLSAAAMSCWKNPSFMDFRCRQTGGAWRVKSWHIPGSEGVPFEGEAVAFYRKDTRYAETLTDLRMRKARAAITPATFTSSVFHATQTIATGNRHQFSNRDACCVWGGHTSTSCACRERFIFFFSEFRRLRACTFLSMARMIFFTMTEIGKGRRSMTSLSFQDEISCS